ncbi:SDR family oxidoreductase [Aquabacterium sp. A7-Y]|uniref:SDR family NAD(P)-dependent oxidoreductase n=1 Tax=Aquabacterium sp. A7-Y TaxID=1349605 RepID=UPI00223CB4EC|nr:SDR family NAD(P)-dependent oxidoreductase [Aquabacterium sp. A7-Y]MCW7539971.1 SDR family oxidoreductase [Aquabacterium sp. A7-Y]
METFSHSKNAAATRQGQDMAQRHVLVVGGGQAFEAAGEPVGNGRATCLALARRGARVVCADRSLQAAQATVALIEAEGGQAWAVQADIAQPDEATAIAGTACRLMGRLDGLVLNAGISDRRPLPEVTADSWDRILNVNSRGHLLCVQAALPLMSPGAAIVFVSSVAALLPLGRNPAYEASKAALGALCRATAMEGHSRDIRANLVLAGLIDTPMGRAAGAARPGRAAGALPFGRQGSAWEIASAIGFLLSDQAAYINAVELPVDGGLCCGIGRPPPTP